MEQGVWVDTQTTNGHGRGWTRVRLEKQNRFRQKQDALQISDANMTQLGSSLCEASKSERQI